VQSIRKILSSAWQALFGDPVRAFGVVSLGLLLALAIAPAKEHFSQWHSYQRHYLWRSSTIAAMQSACVADSSRAFIRFGCPS